MAVGASAPDSFESLQPHSESGQTAVLGILRHVQKARTQLDCGLSRRIERRAAVIASVTQHSVVLADANFSPEVGELLRVAFDLEGRPYCFEASVLEASTGRVAVDLPRSVSHGERRSRERFTPSLPGQETVSIEGDGVRIDTGRLVDISPEGISVYVPDHPSLTKGLGGLAVRRAGASEYGKIRYKTPVANQAGWVQLGIELWPTQPRPVSKENIEETHGGRLSGPNRLRQKLSLSASVVGAALDRASQAFYSRQSERVQVVEYADEGGREIRGIVDSWGDPSGATAVVIPPAWGRTKETLLPLAHTIVSAFRAAKQPVQVLRFDGIGKRGESYREPVAHTPGHECIRMRFSQGVEDIRSAVDYLHSNPTAEPSATFVVSFSAASIEARRAVATDDRIGGWVCVVGSADLQSMMKRISGGVDFALGIERGVRFGHQEILGVTVDMDLAGRDALDHNLVYMADARRDMAQINVPITWIYGRSDAWMDVGRVEDILSQGNSSRRRLIGTPMGHMLRSSQQALSVFHFIASELSRIGGTAQTLPVRPALSELARKQRAERLRKPAPPPDVKAFWESYLLGGENGGGYEVLTSISPFADFMKAQIKALDLGRGNVVADIGSGTGEFLQYSADAEPKCVVEIDLIRQAMSRVREGAEFAAAAEFVQADLASSIPLADQSVDRVIASLVLSYVPSPQSVLAEVKRILRPDGRLVVSTLVADADMSKLFMEGVEELKERSGVSAEGAPADDVLRSFTNHASRLLDLEEQGAFRFWEPAAFQELLREAGWDVESVEQAFGSPPQAVIVSATRAR